MPWASRLTGRRAKAPSGLAKLTSCASRPLTLAHHAVTQALKDELTGTFPGLRVIAKPMTRVNPGEELRWKRGPFGPPSLPPVCLAEDGRSLGLPRA